MQAEKAFGEVLRELRLERQLSQEALALEAGVQRNYVSLLERGMNSASINILFKLSPILGVTVSQLMSQVEERMQLTRHAARKQREAAKLGPGLKRR